jgi:hypothetical protein
MNLNFEELQDSYRQVIVAIFDTCRLVHQSQDARLLVGGDS